MDLVKLGVVIDPTGAETGAKRANAAAESMEKKIPDALDKVEKAEKKAGEAAKKMGEETRKGAATAEAAVAKVASSSAFERLKQRATQTMTAVRASFQFNPGTNAYARVVQIAQRAGMAIGGAFTRARALATQAVTAIGTTGSRALGGTFTTGVNAASRAVSTLTSGLSKLKSGFTSIVPSLGTMNVGLGKLTAVLGGLYLAFQAVSAGAAGITNGSEIAGNVARATKSFEALTDSAAVANSMVQRLRETARKGGTDLAGSLDNVNKYVALGFSPADAVKLDKNLADIAGSLGLSAAKANEVAVALVQVKAQTTVAITELRDQIAEKGVPIMSELANKLKVSQAQLKELVSEGKVDAKELIDIFLNMEGGFAKFTGGVERATQTLPGALARLKANFQDVFAVDLFTPINAALVPLVNRAATAIGKLGATANTVGTVVGSALTAMIEPLVSGLEEASAWLVKIQPQLQAFVAVLNEPGGFKIALNAGIDAAMDLLRRGLEACGMVFESIMARASHEVMKLFMRMTEPSFWKGLADALYNAGVEFVNIVKAGITNILLALHEANSVFGRSIYAPAVNALAGAKDMTAREPGAPMSLGAAPAIMSFGEAWSKTTERPTVNTVKFGNAMADQLKKPQAGAAPLVDLPTTVPGASTAAASTSIEKEATKTKRAVDELGQAAQKYIQATRTPMEQLKATQAEINMLLEKGRLDQETATRAQAQAMTEYNQGMDQQKSQLQQLMGEWGNLKLQMDQAGVDIAQMISGNMSGALTDWINGTKSASQAFDDMAKSIVNDLTRIATQMLINWAIQKAIGFAVGAISGGAGAAATSAATSSAAVAHTGGRVSHSMANQRTMTMTSFADAPRYQHGGMVGVSSGEVPAVMEPGEEVLTRDRASDIKGRMADSSGESRPQMQAVTVINVTDPSTLDAHIMKNPQSILNVIGTNASVVKRMLGVKNSAG